VIMVLLLTKIRARNPPEAERDADALASPRLLSL